ncbi:RPN13_C domain-containing protein [Meloidogyne graminicola]|uniref:RPN13_C domain-containing protein n=1 Tax=Meloidogyne graminicola TaxID=189291 RepID=A0A8S9ZVZ8_9BILA|nr:RPN13_C domain-containing protein [Meloidogyne graminicola]
MSVMFANTGSSPVSGGYLLEFQAGRTMLEPGSTKDERRAVAKQDPGSIYVKHSQDDQLLHLCWKNRLNGATELDLIIFPGETEFLRVNECKDGRVFMLKFKNSEERHLFWMQGPDEGRDAEVLKKMNELLSNAPPTRTTPARTERTSQHNLASLVNINMEDLGALANMDQKQLMRLFSVANNNGNLSELMPQLTQLANAAANAGYPIGQLSSLINRSGANATPSTRTSKISSAAATSGSKVNAQTLSQIIGSLPSGEGISEKDKKTIIDMATILKRNNTQQVVEKYKEQLIPHLPNQGDLQNVNDELIQTVGNPQFQQSADFIGQALQLGQLGQALEHFHLNRSVIEAATKGDLTQFAEKLTAQEVDKLIENEANDEQNIANELTKQEENQKKKKEEAENIKVDKPSRERDDDMELD